MNLTIRPMTPAERLYPYAQPEQIIDKAGSIGHLRGDMGSSGKEFYTSWTDHRNFRKTQDFKDELDFVINALRFNGNYGGVLKDRSSLAAYCHRHPESSFGGDGREYGFRADTESYSYMFRLNPHRGEYNLYCFCYCRDFLDTHMKQAENGIRFITPFYFELFRIPDGGMVRITYPTGAHDDMTCRYIDDYHFETGWNSIYHIRQFTETMARHGNTIAPI